MKSLVVYCVLFFVLGCSSSKSILKDNFINLRASNLDFQSFFEKNKNEIAFFSASSDESKRLFENDDLAVKSLKKFLLGSYFNGQSPREWKMFRLGRAFHQPSLNSNDQELFNKVLIWARTQSGQGVYIRPVRTNTGCNTGCTPVVFYLVFSEQAEFMKLLLDPKNPLRKVWHVAWTLKDVSLVEKNLAQLKSITQEIDNPVSVINRHARFPYQTRNFGQKLYVEGAALTSQRIYEAAHSTIRAIELGESARREKLLEWRRLSKKLETIDSVVASQTLLKKWIDELNSDLPVYRKKWIWSLAPVLLRWQVLQLQDDVSLLSRYFSREEFGRHRVQDLCAFYESLLEHQQGQAYLMGLAQQNVIIGNCVSDSYVFVALARWTSSLNSNSKSPQLLASLAKNLASRATPYWVEKRPKNLEAYALGFLEAGLRPKAVEVFAYLRYRYSRYSFSSRLKLLEKENTYSSLFDRHRKIASGRMNNHPAGSTLKFKIKLPSVKKSQQKTRVWIFFSSWCPHCKRFFKKTLSTLRSNPIMMKQVRFLEIFSRGPSVKKQFCRELKMSFAECRSIYTLKNNSKRAKGLMNSLKIFRPPQIVLSHQNGTVLNNNFYFDIDSNLNFVDELEWALQTQ